MQLLTVSPSHVDRAWKDGASCLEEACKLVDEITGSQLKLILSRGERTLVAMREEEKTVGWGCFRIDQLPNIRVLHITDLVAHNGHFETFFDEIKKIAEQLGCSRIRCAALPAQARLYRIKCGFEPVYETLEIKIS
jgi:hypothetical protein